MRKPTSMILAAVVLAAFSSLPLQVYGLAIVGTGDATGTVPNAVTASTVRISDPGGLGTGTVIGMQNVNGDIVLTVLTADHVVRNAAGGGSTLYSPNQISVSFGNSGGGGASFAASRVETHFDIPQDGSSFVDMAIIGVCIPGSQLNTLPLGVQAIPLAAAAPGAGDAITQAGYGLQGTVTNVSGNPAYVYSAPNGLGAPYGTLKAGINSIGAITPNVTGAVSDYAGINYQYDGFTGGAVLSPDGAGGFDGTSYIFSGDSGGPTFEQISGNYVLVGVHSSSVTGELVGDPNSEFAYPTATNASYKWKDVSVYSYLTWINDTIANINADCCGTAPEPASLLVLGLGAIGLIRRRR